LANKPQDHQIRHSKCKWNSFIQKAVVVTVWDRLIDP